MVFFMTLSVTESRLHCLTDVAVSSFGWTAASIRGNQYSFSIYGEYQTLGNNRRGNWGPMAAKGNTQEIDLLEQNRRKHRACLFVDYIMFNGLARSEADRCKKS
jgi:hypothetical protein